MLKLSQEAGELTVIVPVETEQVGCCVTLAVGAAGAVGCEFTVTVVVPAETQVTSVDDLAVTVYVPAGIRVNIPVVLV